MNALFPNSALRRATEADIPRGLQIAEQAYPGRGISMAVDWAKWHLRQPNSLVLIGDRTLGIASLAFKYGFEKRGRLDMLAAIPEKAAVLEALQQVRAMVRWATLQGAVGNFRIDADTGVDFGAFARRLGGHEVDPVKYPRYDIPLTGGML
jgi:hypothetical protein